MQTSTLPPNMPQWQQAYTLIDGVFEPERAIELLMALINHKMTYHNLEILSMEERGLGTPMHSRNRVLELKEAGQDIKEQIKLAARRGLKVQIRSSIEITFSGE